MLAGNLSETSRGAAYSEHGLAPNTARASRAQRDPRTMEAEGDVIVQVVHHIWFGERAVRRDAVMSEEQNVHLSQGLL